MQMEKANKANQKMGIFSYTYVMCDQLREGRIFHSPLIEKCRTEWILKMESGNFENGIRNGLWDFKANNQVKRTEKNRQI
jgi:hypothetical protein